MVFAAWLRRLPAAVTEADAHLGLANRLAAPFARRVLLAYPVPGRDGAKYRVVGRPIPTASQPTPRDEARRRFELPLDGPVVLVAGGSLGARTLNETALAAWSDSGPAVLHLCGAREYEQLRGRVTRPEYRLLPFVDDYGAALGAADVVLSRAGGSVWEIAAAGKPAILVPYPDATADHQRKNAEYFARAGGAVIVPDEEARDRVPALVEELLADPEELERRGEAMRAAAKPQAAEEIANELIALATARR
jgi:UDP-N-acetylglucosamine--N-acetylmuramyl-(pentapeptide) pyrophosphoryl-undecaprenol N-acetylglucosamine transferase